MSPEPISLSDQDIQAAYERVRQPGWPSLSDIHRAARLYQIVRSAAISRRQRSPQPVQTPAPIATPTAKAQPAHHRPLPFDAKRAAAGERDDD